MDGKETMGKKRGKETKVDSWGIEIANAVPTLAAGLRVMGYGLWTMAMQASQVPSCVWSNKNAFSRFCPGQEESKSERVSRTVGAGSV